MLVIAAVAAIAVLAVALFYMFSGPKWDDPVDDWVLNQEVHEGDYIEYADRFTIESIDGDRCTVRKNSDSSTIEMSKQEFLRLLSAKDQASLFFEGYTYLMTMKLDKEESIDGLKVFEGEFKTDMYGKIEKFDTEFRIGPHNILETWEIEDLDFYTLDTNLSFVDF